jgi:putative ATP-dependent endonuclease of OLD family
MTHFPPQQEDYTKLHPDDFQSLEALGIALVNANSDSQIAPLGEHFGSLGKVVFAVFDKQEPAQKAEIEAKVQYAFEAPEKSFESVLLKGTQEAALRR